MNEWTRIDIDEHLLNQEALIDTGETIQTVTINAHEIAHRQLQSQLGIILILSIWLGYAIAPQFLPTKRDIAG